MDVVDERLLYSKSEFADGLGLSRAAVTRAINQERIVVDPVTDKIDPNYPTNLAYVQHIVTNNRGSGLSDQFKQQLQAAFVDVEKKKRKKKFSRMATNAKVTTAFNDIASRLDEDVSTDTKEGEELFDRLMEQGLLHPGEQLKIAQTTLANLRIAREMDDLVAKDMVKRFFTRLSGIVSSRLLCLGQRSAKGICSLFGNMSGEMEIAVQKELDDEVAAAVEAIQREIADAVEW